MTETNSDFGLPVDLYRAPETDHRRTRSGHCGGHTEKHAAERHTLERADDGGSAEGQSFDGPPGLDEA